MRTLILAALPLLILSRADAGCTLNTLAGQTYGAVQTTTSYQFQQDVQPACTYSQPMQYAAPVCAAPVAAAYALPTYSTPVLAAPVYRTYVPQQSYAVQRSVVSSYQAPVVQQPVIVRQRAVSYGYGAPAADVRFLGPPVRQGFGASAGGFRAGFAGAGLNAGGGGAGFLTGGGLLGGAANLLGVSSAGLEGAALGVLATRSNLFGLAPKRR